MHYRKPYCLMMLVLAGVGLAVAGPVRAATADQASGSYFKGPTAVCLSHTTLVYPCVSLSPPAYQASPGAGIVSAAVTPQLPLDAGTHNAGWLERIKNGEYWDSQWHLSRQLRGMNMDLSLNHSGASVNMGLGPLKLHVTSEDGNISESRFFLGIERSW